MYGKALVSEFEDRIHDYQVLLTEKGTARDK